MFIHSLALGVWQMFLRNSSATTHQMNKWPIDSKSGIICSTELTNYSRTRYGCWSGGKQNAFFFFLSSSYFDCAGISIWQQSAMKGRPFRQMSFTGGQHQLYDTDVTSWGHGLTGQRSSSVGFSFVKKTLPSRYLGNSASWTKKR